MPKKIDLKKLLNFADIVAAIILIIGLFIAIFSSEIAMKVIGFSIAILAFVKIILSLGQRINVMVESNKLHSKIKPTEVKVTEKKDKKAKRFVIEDYIKKPGKKEEKQKNDFTKEINDDEGFRLIKEDDDQDKKQQDYDSKPKTESENKINVELNDLDFEDEFSSVKIIKDNSKKDDINISNSPKEDNETIHDTNKLSASKKPQTVSEEELDIKMSFKGSKIDIPITELIETEPAFGNEPRKEFEYFLKKVLVLIRSVTNTNSAVFTLVNYDKQEFIVEAYDSDIPDKIAIRKKIPFTNDIVTQIIYSLKPEILTDINPTAELDLIPYYTNTVGTSSFFGIPVFYDETLIGVLCIDSDESNAYDVSLLPVFGQYAKLIASLVKAYTQKYDLLQQSSTLDAINTFRQMIKSTDLSLDKIYETLLATAITNFDNMLIGIIGMDTENHWSVQHIKNLNYPYDLELGTIVTDDRSLAGQTLFRNRISIASPLRINDFRLNTKETKLNEGFFVSIPISSFSNTFGALFLQGSNTNEISQYDIDMLKTLSEHAATAIEQIYFTEMLKKSALFDLSTGLLNTPAFIQRLNEEVMRSSDFGYPMTLCLIEIDKYKALDPEKHADRFESVLSHTVDIIHNKIRPYDLLGRAESNIFGVVLIDVNSQNAKIWAEKLRADIAISVMKLGNDRFTVTVSIGVAQLGKNEAIEDVMENAMEMLKLSKQKSNTVTVYE